MLLLFFFHVSSKETFFFFKFCIEVLINFFCGMSYRIFSFMYVA